jgi:hypothetical protein
MFLQWKSGFIDRQPDDGAVMQVLFIERSQRGFFGQSRYQTGRNRRASRHPRHDLKPGEYVIDPGSKSQRGYDFGGDRSEIEKVKHKALKE